jgi:hypothetical protein
MKERRYTDAGGRVGAGETKRPAPLTHRMGNAGRLRQRRISTARAARRACRACRNAPAPCARCRCLSRRRQPGPGTPQSQSRRGRSRRTRAATPRVAAAEAIGAERHIASRHVRADQVRHGPHVIRRGDDRPSCLAQQLRDIGRCAAVRIEPRGTLRFDRIALQLGEARHAPHGGFGAPVFCAMVFV